MKNHIKDLRNQLIPLIFSINLTYWTMSLFMGYVILGTLIVAVILHSTFFIWFKYIYKNKKFGGIYFTISSALYIFIALIISSSTKLIYRMDLFSSFAIMKANGTFIMGYWLSGLMLIALFFSTAVFYFFVIRIRIPVLLLISIIPLSLQTLMKDNAVNLPFIIFLALFLLLNMEYTKMKISTKDLNYHINKRWYLQARVVFLSITLLIAIVIPKPNTIPKIANLDRVISNFTNPFTNLNNGNGNRLSSQSDITSTRVPTSTKIIFEVQAEEPLYLRTQSFDKYEGNHWIIEERLPSYSLIKKDTTNSKEKLSTINSILESINYNIPEESQQQQMLNANSVPQQTKSAHILTKNYQMECFLNVIGLLNIDRVKQSGKIYLNEKGNFVLADNRNLNINESYGIDYISPKINTSSKEFKLLKYMNPERYEYISNIATKSLKSNVNLIKTLKLYKNEMDAAYENYTELPSNITARTFNLANKITEGKISDYDKATAIEDFFNLSNFKYGETKEKPTKGADYNDFFLFESKKGICVQFASAMVILARANGLPARYVEGYKADEQENGKYIVREKNAHAFPEVYIAGYGWKTFEPTVDAVDPMDKINQFFGNIFNKINTIITKASVVMGSIPIYVKTLFIPICIFIIMLFIRTIIIIREIHWKKKILKANKKQAIEDIFSRTNSVLKKINYHKKNHETPTNYAIRIFDESGISLDKIIDVFNKSKYGDIEPSSEEILIALSKYQESLIFVKNHIGKIKAWII